MHDRSVIHIPLSDEHPDCLHLPLETVRFPVELRAPSGFRPRDAATWPVLDGRLEYVNGRILYMPPCGDLQQDVATALTGILFRWLGIQPGFVVGSNEAGMLLGGEVRGAEAAVWRRDALGAPTGGFRTVAPVLAAEVAGRDEGEAELREKARWYRDHGAEVVWIALPSSRELLVIDAGGERRLGAGDRVPLHPSLPGLDVPVAEIFSQLR